MSVLNFPEGYDGGGRLYTIRVCNLLSGDLQQEVKMPDTARVGDILFSFRSEDATLRRSLLLDGQTLSEEVMLSEFLPPAPCTADLQLLVQRRTLQHADFELDEHVVQTVHIVLGGHARVGKTSLALRYCRDKFYEDSIPSDLSVIPVDFRVQRITDDNCGIKMVLWDEPMGQRWFMVRSAPFRSKHALILVFDVCDRRTFRDLGRWLSVARDAGLVTVVLIGNKSDLEPREVSREEGRRFAAEEGIIYFETSAKEGLGVEDVINYTVFDVLQKLAAQEPPPPPGTPEPEIHVSTCHLL
ncbi:unnamed protein product [Effrenium voratum]|uniref:Uncharacterized protein n=1 Tax=Effrenium voratum TaxID=2562239 RepID=A0AA36HVY4_9DINO|nr:unnamed protein product [Effrenium voratum]CAJ1414358.1 unnamed protein product [Effrenium voratum]